MRMARDPGGLGRSGGGGGGRQALGHPLRERQAAFNATSRGHWEGFAEHRGRLTGVLCRGAEAGRSRLCVLGAGNANDVDLPGLLGAHGEVHLVDLDARALALGAERQGVAGHPRLFLHGGLDVTATLDVLSGWHPLSRVRPADLEALASWPADRVPTALPGGFDRVASTCVLSQLQETAGHALGPGHGQLEAVESALRAGHLRLMARLATPGGVATLVTEIVSSDTLPDLPGRPAEDLAGLLGRLRRTGNHFRGMHPEQLLAAIRADRSLGATALEASPLPPWRWRLHGRTYLVGGVTFRPR
ncbi:hypothetical protein OJF2_00760 [Aquisphaera giovannonii]|uniref:Class I SAM-dependent methyltransferase n=1 Tax=Aquisphaera giovannonii TaxID=406548 RepID=A0A5B9VV02_9BACT|nr:hypothetical protein [Aquisphaera giovannonii]QEH31611.1 hypothetical protein OJF2_00760 [Aquisphaera giovannonii]